MTHSIRQGPPADGTDKLICVVFLLVFVQDTLHRVKLECQQCLGKSFVVKVQGVVLAACTNINCKVLIAVIFRKGNEFDI